MIIRVVGILLLVGTAVASAACHTPAPAGSVTVGSWNVHADVQGNGDVEVQETISARFTGGATRFERVVDARTDGLVFERATMDGTPASSDLSAKAHVTVTGGPRLDVTWTFPDGLTSTHEFTLSYRATRAVEIDEGRGRLVWPVVPPVRSYEIGDAQASLSIPQGAVMYDPSGMAERGWTVTREPNGIRAERRAIPPGEAGTILAKFSVQSEGMTEAQWQLDADRAHEFGPAFLAAGIMILSVGAGVLWILWFQYPRKARRPIPGVVPQLASAAERASVARDLARAGWATLVLAALLALIARAITGRYGPSGYAIAAATAADGVIFLIVARRFP